MISRLTSSTTPEGKGNPRYFSYANSGGGLCAGDPSAVCSRTDERGTTTTYVYDALNRLTSKGYSDGTPLVTFQYDLTNLWGVNIPNALGRLVNASTWNGSTMLTTSAFLSYDAMGRVQWYLQCNPDNCGGGGWSTTYSYDLAGDIQSWTHPAGFTLTNTISTAQRVTAVSSSLNDSTHPPVLASGITYTPWGAISSLTNGCAPSGSCANVQETYSYNNRLQPTGVQLGTNTNSSAYYSLAYNYSWSSGQIPGCPLQSQSTGNNGDVMGYTYTDSQNSGLSHTATYFYDSVNRLACAQATGNSTYNLDFSYDPYGNMTCVQNGSTNGYCPQNSFNAYNQISGYPYDAAGDLTNDPTHNFQYDAEQRVKSVGNGAVAEFTYNALGQRVEGVWWGGNPLDFLFDPSGAWLGQGASGAVYLGSRQLAFENPGGGTDFMHVNPLNSTTMETTYNGGVASDVLFYPFGDLWTNAEIQDYQFAGTIWMDSGSTADLASYRLYRYDLGRWLTPDPLAGDVTNPQSLNRYAYVLNNPTSLTDPSGLQPDDCADWETNAACAGPPPPSDCVDVPMDCYPGESGIPDENPGNPPPSVPPPFPAPPAPKPGLPTGNWGFPNGGVGLPWPSAGAIGCDFVTCGIPVWNPFTIQVGGSINLNFWFITFNFSGGFAIDSHGHVATYQTKGLSTPVGRSGSIGTQVAYSNADTVCELGGPFLNASGTFGAGGSVTADVFQGTNGHGGTVTGGGVTAGAGGGASGSVGVTTTNVTPIASVPCH